MLVEFCLFGLPGDVREWFELLFSYPPTKETVILLCLTFIAICAFVKLIIGDICGFKARKKKVREVLSDYGKDYSGKIASWLYIPTRFQSSPPDMAPDLSYDVRTIASQNMMEFFLKQALVPRNKEKHLYLILGGSGMGKSSFVVQLVKEYYKKYLWKYKPFELALIPCGSINVLSRIERIENKKNTVLILDALDECSEAIDDFLLFMNSLESVIQEFFHVIITCRTQFFNGEDEIIHHSKLPSQSKDKGFLPYNVLFVAPFRDQDIDRYLIKKYFFYPRKRHKAKVIVAQNSALMVRPLVLSYIDDLVKKGISIRNKAELYRIIVTRWIEREVNIEPDKQKRSILKDDMYEMSVELALLIFKNWVNNGGLYLPYEDFVKLERKYQIKSGIKYSYRGRSLVNWDEAKNRKFAHRSFWEYFLAEQMVRDSSVVSDYAILEGVNGFYEEMCNDLIAKEVREKRVIHKLVYRPIYFRYISLLEKPQCEYRHFVFRTNMLVIDWAQMCPEMKNWLASTGTDLLIVKHYRSGDYSTVLTEVKGLMAVYFYAPVDLPSLRLQKQFALRRIGYSMIPNKWDENSFESIYYTFSFQQKRVKWFEINLGNNEIV